ncbi:MAG: serine/threonine protein kinase [Proteobacteria bacterium]|nr:serine/threonine protein kinase [Pseudomonadota bacterium]
MKTLASRDWPVISVLFDQALDLPASQRAAWLASLADAHRAALERLLAVHAQAETENFLGELPRVGIAREPDPADCEALVRTIGPYRLIRELGRGGMGSVWLAERADGLLQRQVALKLPHPGLATRSFADRLERERDILAPLTHPHIARLYDAGVSPEGQPYIALEYVQGKTLIAHCADHGLGTRARVVLFLQVLAAVQYAHAHLVIHRDLKPSNVLVDEEGQVHLLDFGVAKLLVDGQAAATELTLDSGLALTPDYASPEQIAGAAISIASDVYALGVLLYELLAGVRPYHLPRSGRAILERAVQEIDVPPPSEAARAQGSADAAAALRGDLDTIVLKAMKKLPGERYPTADALAQDLTRHLEGVPVLARRDAWGYRAGRFIRRHRVAVAGAAVVFVALGVGLAGTLWQARLAERQARRAQAVQKFLVGLFNEADPAKAQGRELTARQMLDRGRSDVQVELNDQSELQTVLEGLLVDLYTKLGDENKVLPIAEALRDRALHSAGPNSLAYGDALFALGRVHGGLAHHALAYDLYGQAHHVLEQHAKERAGDLLRIEGHQAQQLTMLDRPAEAIAVEIRLLPKLEAQFGPGNWELLRQQATLAGIYSDQGEHAKAADLIAQVLPKLDRADAPHALDAVELRIDLGYAVWNARRYEDARVLLERGIAQADSLLGPANTMSVTAQRTLGLLFASQGRFEQAAQTFADSIERSRRLGGEDSAPTRFAESFAVPSLVMVGRGREAREMALRSVERMTSIEGISASVARGFDRRVGLAWVAAGDYPRAVQVLEDVLDREAEAHSAEGGAHGTTLLYLAGARAGLGLQAQAAEAAGLAAQAFAQGAPNVAGQAHAKLTEALARARLHQPVAAEALIEQARVLLAKVPQPTPTDPLFVELVRAETLRQTASQAEAQRVERAARDRLEVISGAVPSNPLLLVF